MSDPDGFLSRWSRRKREALRPGGEPADRISDTAAETGLAPAGAEPPPVEMSLEDIAALPKIEDLTSETDLVQFLQAGVPAILRKAALRRMWLLDPAIRDFVGEARDYSWDWNVEGGVPTFGPLLPSDDVQATLDGMFSRFGDEPDPAAPEAAAARHDEPQDEGEDVTVTDTESLASAEEPIALAEPASTTPLFQPERATVAAQAVRLSTEDAPLAPSPVDGGAAPVLPPRRRHGAARPKLD